jgi:flavodoxin
MSGLIICYSFSGTSLKYAKKLQQENGYTLVEISEKAKRTKANAYLTGVRQARAHKSVELSSPLPDMDEYDRITMVFPIWGGYPAPAFNTVVDNIPAGKEITLYLLSGGGKTSDSAKNKLRSMLTAKGCVINRITDIKGSTV